MRTLPLLGILALTAPMALAQNRVSLVYTQRFDAVSLDSVNERVGGSLNQIREFDLAVATPGANAIARSWLPTTAHSAMQGDPHGDNNYAKYFGIKTTFEQFNFAGPFVKFADRGKRDARLVYWTIRDASGVATRTVQAFTTNGTQKVTILPGDFWRWGANGNAEFFVTQALFAKAQGAPPPGRSQTPGADAIVQDAAGNLYFSPRQGGGWVAGNGLSTGPVFCNDGSLCMIRAQDITYDAQGNVQDVVADSAFVLWEEIAAYLGSGPTVRSITVNAKAVDYNGTLIDGTAVIPANMVGLALDPNGGTLQANYPHSRTGGGQVFQTVPHLIWCWDNGGFAGTIFSSRDNPILGGPGSIAVINSIPCGSDNVSVPANGAWLGLTQDKPNFRPTLMGLATIDELANPPFTADAPKDGVIQPIDANLAVDFFPGPGAPTFLFLCAGPTAAGSFQSSLDVSFLVGADSFRSAYMLSPTLITLPIGSGNTFGYLTFSTPNPNSPSLLNSVLLVQGARLGLSAVELSNPVQLQFKP